jgi:D-aminoacyl-tRNA deacylase
VIGIVISRQDTASTLIGDQLRLLESWEEHTDTSREDDDGGGSYYTLPGFSLREFDDLHIDLRNVEEAFDAVNLIVFPSRHAGETGKLLTTHFTGNIGPADYGGQPNTVSLAAPAALTEIYERLAACAPSRYDVGIEATHHGPLVTQLPSLFVEIGSSESEWNDSLPAETIARAILDLPDGGFTTNRVIVGFGGGHYAPRFERILRETDWSLGHIAADWSLDRLSSFDSGIIDFLFERSNTTLALIDGDRPELESYLDSHGFRPVSETWLRETSGVSLSLVNDLEASMDTIDNGLRFGAGTFDEQHYEIYHIAPELIEKATSLAPQQTRSALHDHAISYLTRENGNLVTGTVAVTSSSKIQDIFDEILVIFKHEFEAVERANDEIHVTDREFRPDLAEQHVVVEGPAFGQLAAGNSVEVDGSLVTPDMVFREYTETYPLTVTKSRYLSDNRMTTGGTIMSLRPVIPR